MARTANPLGNLPAKAARMWEHTYESSLERGLDKSGAAASAWCAVKRHYYKKGDRWLKRKKSLSRSESPPGCTSFVGERAMNASRRIIRSLEEFETIPVGETIEIGDYTGRVVMHHEGFFGFYAAPTKFYDMNEAVGEDGLSSGARYFFDDDLKALFRAANPKDTVAGRRRPSKAAQAACVIGKRSHGRKSAKASCGKRAPTKKQAAKYLGRKGGKASGKARRANPADVRKLKAKLLR